MPSDDFFGFSVLIAGRPVPEYAKDGRVYVESNLYAPFSYRQKTEQLVNGEMEIESAPVTPYQVQIRLASHCEDSAVFVYVDGVLASKFMMEQAQSKIITGFVDKEGTREFLFSLPRFAADETDRISSKRESRIGSIEVIRCEASYVKQEYRTTTDTVFNQATKKDAYRVTEGKYTMSTTKKGKLIHQVKPYDVQLKKLWRIGRECGRLTVHYRMGHTLEGMGVELRPTDWTKIVSQKSSKERSSSSSSVELQGSPQAQSPEASPPPPPPTVRLSEQPAESINTSNRHHSSPSVQTTPPPSLSPQPIFHQPTIFVAQNSAGGLIYFPSIILPVKSEPEDPAIDIASIQKCP
jgi:hypothetical protein